ncbi:MAG: hypothetical protein DCC72_04600 [Burkholderiales bacterium]|jgi:uncharacterized protein|nr:MAG: hypothetical protein DCC72_04600 [Burkholderiales bacterium]
MGKLLSWVVLIALAWLVIRLFAISQRRRERAGDSAASAGASGGTSTSRREASDAPDRALEGEPIVPCAHCGLFVPASDAVREDGFDYCSPAHRDADRVQRRSRSRDGRAPS